MLHLSWRNARWLVLVLIALFSANPKAETPANGVLAVFKSGEDADALVLPNFWYYLPEGQGPTPFLRGRSYTLEMSGFVSVDLRSQYAFQAEAAGHLVLEVNGKEVLNISNPEGAPEPSRPLRLNKGTNSIVVRFTPPEKGDAQFRLYWIAKDSLSQPIPDASLTYAESDLLVKGASLRHGRLLFAELRCVKCHIAPASGMPELAMDAPSFDNIGGRLNAAWMADWIENPPAQRGSARMPRIYHGETARKDAEAAAAFLASLASADAGEKVSPAPKEQVDRGEHLFGALHCSACHNVPASAENDPAKVSLAHVQAKFQPGALRSFLLRPQEHFKWIRMPDFKLNEEEAASLAAFLRAKATEANPREIAASLRTAGEEIVQQSGCYNCHSGPGKSELKAMPAAQMSRTALDSGCLAPAGKTGSAPEFNLTEKDRAALKDFLRSELPSIRRDVPREFALRQTELLNCRGCHGKIELVPHMEILGGKLNPEWSARFIAGEVPYKPRPWLEARMPAFHPHAEEMAAGLAMLHGYPAKVPEQPPIDEEMAKVGQTLVSANGGFSCVACHAAGDFAATQVFESAGINLAYSAERLLHPFYHRWVINPLAIDPTTKMPVYFDGEGRSPLPDVYDGDGRKQIEAMWQYLRLGQKMPPPPQ